MLIFNASKRILMQFHRSNHSICFRLYSYKLGDQSISSKTTHKDLGLILHNNLNWTNHYDHICSAAYRILGLLKRTFSSTCPIAIIVLFSDIWRPALIKDIRKLERGQTKFIVGDYRNRLIKLDPLM